MSRFTAVAAVLVGAFVTAQLIRPERANPSIDPAHAIQAHESASSELVAVLDRSCGDCHSNATAWSAWYTQLAPLSWLMAHEVAAGRQAVNFSEWTAYTSQQQRKLLAMACDDAKSGKMPGPYPFFKPETRLSVQDIQTICAAARQSEANATRAAR